MTLALATACGSEDDKKRNQGDEAGAGGQAGAPEIPAGGSKSDGGEPSAGQPPVAMGGAGGEPPVVEPMGGAGGAPPELACCQPLTCEQFLEQNEMECGYGFDGCGDTIICNCAAGLQCDFSTWQCEDCTPNVEYCSSNPYACGNTVDNCGNPITCPDDCASQASDLFCIEGQCRSCKTDCDFNDCGVLSDNCGGTIDCTASACEGDATCGPNGTCCTVNPNACSNTVTCSASVWDGCKFIQCGCEANEACIDEVCYPSQCQVLGEACGGVENPTAEAQEDCGPCSGGEVCRDNVCLPVCD